MAPSSKSKVQSKPAGRDIRGFFGGGSSGKLSGPTKPAVINGSARSKAIEISDEDDDKPVKASSSKHKPQDTAIKPKSERAMDTDEDEKPIKPAMKRKKASALISSDEEDEPKTSPPRKKVAISSPKKNPASSTSKSRPVPKPAPTRKPVPKKSKDMNFIAPSDSEEDIYSELKSKGKTGAKKTPSKAEVSKLKSTPKKQIEEKATNGAKDGEGDKPKSKFNWAAKAAKLAAGPAAPGSKQVPESADPNCLAGLSFVFTGELSAFSREEAVDLAKRFGGRVVGQPSSKTSYVILGADAGPSKLAAIKKHGLQTLDEDGFLNLIATRVPDINDDKLKKKLEKEKEAIRQAANEMERREKKAAKSDANSVPLTSQLWTDRYAPRSLKEICGNKGQVEKLQLWLHDWSNSLNSGFKKPGKNGMNTSRAVLITGPPGIGKTTSAHLVAELEGYTPIELNASDARSKKLVENSTNISNTSLDGWMAGTEHTNVAGVAITNKSCLIMDEVDGMSAGDRGGVGALVSLIKKTKIPIICIANDRTAQKLKPLIGNTFNLPFKRPEANAIRSRILSVAFKEKMKIPANVIDQLVMGSQSDIRQVLNMLSTWKLSSDTMDFDEGKSLAKMNEKYTVMTPFDVTHKMLGPYLFSATSRETLGDKMELYFHDPSFMPLFMQENYLKTYPAKLKNDVGPEKELKHLELMDKAASSISDGDLVDSLIHGPEQHWSLMPLHAVCSTVRPASFLYGPGGGYGSEKPICFPTWLGHNSKQGKLSRQLTEIQARMRLKTSADKIELRQSYIPALFPYIVRPLMDNGVSAVDEVIERMDEYFLNREDWDALVELGLDEYRDDLILKKISTATKTAFTKKYNAKDHPIAFHKAVDLGRVPKKIASAGPAPDLEEAFEVDDEIPDDVNEKDAEDDTDVSHDSLIKRPKGKAGAGGSTAAKTKAKAKSKKS
ncbi:DNA replication factor C, large subunit [Irpex rosettiformis]|uniref:DNA replication factor C, large subunit n=1 Tax=Irpex rosettiformis TaxID=378272 RepID=A0ACB8UF34_9APHY|nr:DNA replication factor C, large subunit [Irpex rosettiformis]